MPGVFSPATSRYNDTGSIELGAEQLTAQPIEQPTEQPRDFHFAVTWVTLFAHLNPIEAAGPWRPAVVQPRDVPSTALALVPVVAPPALIPQQDGSSAAWEMVVPKMIRTGEGSFTPAEKGKPELL
jgi:hypothetical protein